MGRSAAYGHTEPEREVPRQPRKLLPYSAPAPTTASVGGRKLTKPANGDQGRRWSRTRG